MAQLLVRQIDDRVKNRIRERAKRNGVSMEEEVRTILHDAVFPGKEEEVGLGTRIANLFKDIPDNDEPLPQLPDTPLRLIKFDE